MALVEFNPDFLMIRGRVGNLVFRKVKGKLVVSAVSEDREPTDLQKNRRVRFREAASYAKRAMADPHVRPVYQEAARESGRNVCNIMVADFLTAPVIAEVDLNAYDGQPGSTIAIHAEDDFEVAAVEVLISNESGEAIETGPAAKSAEDSSMWVYTTSMPIPAMTRARIQVTARDRPGNEAVKMLRC